ncbi:hypothetical protein TEA_017338 [Camellia sinensis var. sinensis]|uniref:Glutamine amidotransferase type-2 domain-containing protein n=1 Tax=Camellia sinensis var. sinensis TaxID=542762 RepID=A0A4S4E989_CAMSN|nr:hypothetical protein TEA_017338 [Camellia sinensis var. sinensis]
MSFDNSITERNWEVSPVLSDGSLCSSLSKTLYVWDGAGNMVMAATRLRRRGPVAGIDDSGVWCGVEGIYDFFLKGRDGAGNMVMVVTRLRRRGPVAGIDDSGVWCGVEGIYGFFPKRIRQPVVSPSMNKIHLTAPKEPPHLHVNLHQPFFNYGINTGNAMSLDGIDFCG